MKVLILFFYILFISVNCFSQIINRDSLTISDTLNISNIYKNVYKTASKDKKIKDDEIKLLKTLRKSLQLSKKQALAIENKFNYSQTNALDQSGRWPLVIQNIGWGAGLYGWGLPYILGVEDGKWFIASELMSFSGSFYLTHKYTKNMNIPHARSQMIRLGSLIGFHYGWSFGKITHQDFDLNSNNKTWATLLMASVPAGIWVGDKLYEKWQPTNGQAWTISLATLLGNMTINNIHNIVSNKPEEPEYIDNSYNPETGTWTDEDSWEETNEYKKYEDNLEKWEINQNILYMATYPISLYLGNRYFGEKNYNFGDALMLYQGYGLGMLYSMIFLDALGNENDNIFLGGLIIGGYSGTYFYEKMIEGYDYSFGESLLMGAGTISGSLFGLAIGVILETEKTFMEIAALSGGIAGTYFTKKILTPELEYLSKRTSKNIQISLVPDFKFIPTNSSFKKSFIPGINMQINF